VKPFNTTIAVQQIEQELGGPLSSFFSEISIEPVAAASLAQVYKAKLVSNGEFVAIKVQRPNILEIVSKDLYVLRRAAEVYQQLMDRFAPQQRTNYVALLNEWAIGFYTELDFLNEAANQQKLKSLLTAEGITGVYIPEVYPEYCTRRILVSEWVDGVKLSTLPAAKIQSLIPQAQEAFLTQLLQIGLFHADPHPGNLMYLHTPRGEAELALLDFGLVAAVKQQDMDIMVSALIHLANKDYANLVDDFINLQVLPASIDRNKVIPLMQKALGPYIKGGGAKQYEAEIRKVYGIQEDASLTSNARGFQQMTQDALTVFNEIPFSIPPYFALLGRAIVTLEGIALTGDPNYGIIMEAYPFVARKLLKEDRPAIQKALQQMLYVTSNGNEGQNPNGDQIANVRLLQGNRLSILINSALSSSIRAGGSDNQTSSSFIDLDALSEKEIPWARSFQFLLSPQATSLRKLLLPELISTSDILVRQIIRKLWKTTKSSLSVSNLVPLPFQSAFSFFPKIEQLTIPFFTPRLSSSFYQQHTTTLSPINDNNNNKEFLVRRELILKELPSARYLPIFLTPDEWIDTVFPSLSREEEFYAISISKLIQDTWGEEVANIANGNSFATRQDIQRTAGKLLTKAITNPMIVLQPSLAFLENQQQLQQQQRNSLAAQQTQFIRSLQSIVKPFQSTNTQQQQQSSNSPEIWTFINKDLTEGERNVFFDSFSEILSGSLISLLMRSKVLFSR
jgi:aarF domain-containing kinase